MLKEALKSVLDPKDLSLVSSSFDIIGDIAIIKIPVELAPKEQIIGKEILARIKNVKTVLKQSSDVQGEFRIRDLTFVSGEEKYETVYKESGCLFKVNLKDAFFTPRLSTERERIALLVQEGEQIFNMFAGIGTFSIVIAKQKRCTIASVDKNPRAVELGIASLALNKKLKGIVNPLLADAMEYSTMHKEEFDRVLMPLPERASEFLASAFESTKKGGTIHYYLHVPENEFSKAEWVSGHLASINLPIDYKITRWKRVREVGPRYIQAVADIIKL